MAQIEHAFPALVKPAQRGTDGVFRPGLNVARHNAGGGQARAWSEYNLRRYDWKLDLLKSSANGLRDYEWFWHHVGVQLLPFWVLEPLSGKHPRMVCGPLGDGSLTTFPLPCQSAANEVVFDDGTPITTYTLRSAANMLADVQAACADVTEWTAQNGSAADAPGVAAAGVASIKVTPSGGSSPRLFTATRTTGITVGDNYTGLAAVLCTNSSAQNYRAQIIWYTAGDVLVSSSSGSNVSISASGGWTLITVAAVAPATAAKARVAAERNDASGTDPYYVDCGALNYGDYDRWHLPSVSPPLIELDSALASNHRLTAYAEGQRMARVRVLRDDANWELESPGTAYPSRLRMQEEIEH
jgi:hypothetical protein